MAKGSFVFSVVEIGGNTFDLSFQRSDYLRDLSISIKPDLAQCPCAKS